VEQWFTLDEGGLDVSMTLHADEPQPVSLGWHPWFRRVLEPGGPPASLLFEADSMLERDPEGAPTGARIAPPPPGPWDDAFTGLRAGPSLEWPGRLRLEIASSCAWWVVYSTPERAICVEPQSGPPDAANLAPRWSCPARPDSLDALAVDPPLSFAQRAPYRDLRPGAAAPSGRRTPQRAPWIVQRPGDGSYRRSDHPAFQMAGIGGRSGEWLARNRRQLTTVGTPSDQDVRRLAAPASCAPPPSLRGQQLGRYSGAGRMADEPRPIDVDPRQRRLAHRDGPHADERAQQPETRS
jgi:hypothetical protein